MRRGVDMWKFVHMLVCCVVLLLGLVATGHTEERWDGSRTWRPDMPRGWYRPGRIIIDRPGKCEVRCERSGREYRCREYRC